MATFGSTKIDKVQGRTLIALSLLVLLLVLVEVAMLYRPSTWIKRDGRFYTNVNVTIVEDLSLRQERFASSWYDRNLGWNHDLGADYSNVAMGTDGEYYPKHPVLMPMLSTPLFWAFDLHGVLLFNMLLFVIAALAGYKFARRYAPPLPSALAALAFLFSTSIRGYTYDYGVDILITALFLAGVAVLQTRRGVLAGVLVGMAVALRPTSLIWAPSLALLVIAERDWKTMWRAVAGGSVVLGCFALYNTLMFGAPWEMSYGRVLVRVAGELQVQGHGGNFDRPLLEGIPHVFFGEWGLQYAFAGWMIALVGLFLLVRKKPFYVAAAAVGFLASLLLFAKYEWVADRFFWPAMALGIPAVAVVLGVLGSRLARIGVVDKTVAIAREPALLAGLCVVLLALGRVGASPTMMRQMFEGDWLEGSANVLGFAIAAWAVVRLTQRVVVGWLAAAVVVGLFCVAPVRFSLIHVMYHESCATALAFVALLMATERRWLVAGLLGIGAAWVAHVPVLAVLGVFVLAYREGPRALRLVALGPAIVLPIWLGMSLALGWPFLAEYSDTTFIATLRSLNYIEGGREMVILLWAGGFGLIPLFVRSWKLALALVLLAGSLVLPGVAAFGGWRWPTLVVLALAPAIAILLESLANLFLGWFLALGKRRWALTLGAVVVLLGTVGGVRRALVAQQPFRAATSTAVRDATVRLQNTDCDFQLWEYMAWECSGFDGTGPFTGLMSAERPVVDRRRRDLLVLPTGFGGQRRTIHWDRVSAEETLEIVWAVPRDHVGAAIFRVRLDGQPVAEVAIPEEPDDELHQLQIDTSAFAGRAVGLTLELQPIRGDQQAVVAVDAFFSDGD